MTISSRWRGQPFGTAATPPAQRPRWYARRALRAANVAVSAVVAIIALVAGALAPSANAKTRKSATVSPDGSAWMKVLRQAVAEVETATESRVTFTIYPGAVQGDDATVFRKIRLRQLHGGLVTAAVFNNIYKDIQIYNLPMAFRSFAEVDAVRETMDPMLHAGLADAGFESFGLAEVGMAYAMSTKEARTVADGRRLKVWTPDGDIAAERTLKAFEIAPIPLTIGDVLGGLQTGLIDTVAAPPVAAVPLLWHTRLKYVVDLPLMYIYGLFVVKADALRDIDEADLATTRRIMRAAVTQADRLNRADHDAAWQALVGQGIQVITPTAAEVADWRSYAERASKGWAEEGIVSTGAYTTLQERLAALRSGGPATTPAGAR